MVNIRRAQSYRDPHHADLYETDRGYDALDPMDEIARLLDDDLKGVSRSGRTREELEDALAAEYQARLESLDPVDLSGQPAGRDTGGRRAQQGAYTDPWDDETIDRFADELADLEDDEFDRFPAGVLPSHREPAQQAEAAPRRRGPILVAASLAVIAVAVAGGWWMLSGGAAGFGEPALVRAPSGPYKIVPDQGDMIEEPVENNIVFNGASEKGEERLVTRDDTIAELPGVQPQVPRVILPNGQEVAAGDPIDLGPRRVRTIIVRPDGTIVESGADASASSTALVPPLQQPAPSAPQSTAALPGMVEASGDPIADLVEPPAQAAGTSPVEPVTLPDAGSSQPVLVDPPSAGLRLPPAEAPGDTNTPAVVAEAPASAEAVAAVPANVPLPKVRPVPPAQQDIVEPVQVASANPATVADAPPVVAAPVAAPTESFGAFVQLSSQRSEAAARQAFAALQGRYPSLLGSSAPDIQRADLGDKGVYYRARVGAPSREAAVQLCERLRAAGGDCLIARN